MMRDSFPELFLGDTQFGNGDSQFGNFNNNNNDNNNNTCLDVPAAGGEDLFAIFDSFHRVTFPPPPPPPPAPAAGKPPPEASHQKWAGSDLLEGELQPKGKRQKTSSAVATASPMAVVNSDDDDGDGGGRMSHITVERNRRKQMNGHLSVLRSLMPSFYVKRGDQASIIGGVVEYIKELQQVLQSLEAKKQRKAYTEILSPRLIPTNSPRPINLPLSPRIPQTPSSPYKLRTTSFLQQHPMFTTSNSNLLQSYHINSPTNSSSSSSNNIILNDGISSSSNAAEPPVASSKSSVADVEVKFSGANLVLKTVSPKIPGQAVKIVSVLEDLCLEILHVGINIVDETMHNSFTIKIGIECQLSAEELAQRIQHTFS